MQDHYSFTDLEFEQQFQTCSFPAALFTHEAHLRLAWIHIEKYGLLQAERNIVYQLKGYVKYLGAADKFNRTVTIAAIKAVSHFKAKSKSIAFQDFIEEFPRLKYNFKEVMACHYSMDIYQSARAKKSFIFPDLLGFES